MNDKDKTKEKIKTSVSALALRERFRKYYGSATTIKRGNKRN